MDVVDQEGAGRVLKILVRGKATKELSKSAPALNAIRPQKGALAVEAFSIWVQFG